MKLANIAAEMRAAGIKRLVIGNTYREHGELHGYDPKEIELFDAPETLPAPPLELDEPTEEKPPGSCVAPGCLERAGFHFAPVFCEAHGLAEFGVSK